MRETAASLRIGLRARAQNHLIELVDRLLEPGIIDGEALQPVLGAVLAAQQRRDDLYLADLLEYHLLPLLNPAIAGAH